MENYLTQVADDLHKLLNSRFDDVKEFTIPDKESESSNYIFNFSKGINGRFPASISLSSDEGIIVKLATDIRKGLDTEFLEDLKDFATQRDLNFDITNISKSNNLHRESVGERKMTESKLRGSSKISYQRIGEAKLIIKHSQPINVENPLGRSQHIQNIYIENAQGERFMYPVKHLNGARAMARHVSHGGTPYDNIGNYVIGLSEELKNLKMFKNYVSRNPMISEAMDAIQPKVVERIDSIKKQIQHLQSESFYQEFAESYTAEERREIPEDLLNDWVDRLTIRSFNEDLKKAFPYIYKLVGEHNIVKELSPEDLLGETQDEVEDKSRPSLFKELFDYEKIIEKIESPTSSLFSKDSKEQDDAVNKLKELLANEFAVGDNGLNAEQSLKGIIEDDELYQIFKELADISPDFDVRYIVKDYVRIKDEELGTDIQSKLGVEPSEPPAEEPAPEPEPAAEPPAEEPPAAPAAPPAAGAPNTAPAPVMASLDNNMLKDNFDPELVEYIQSMFDSTTGNFPKGETGVLIACEKKFGPQTLGTAKHIIGELVSITEGQRLKRLAGLL